MAKIKLLAHNQDVAGVLLHRTINPMLSIEKNHSDEFEVTINQNVNWTDYEYLKQFDIITGHRQFCEYHKNDEFFDFCEKNDIVTVLDIDDFPSLYPGHSLYSLVKSGSLDKQTFETIKRCTGISTTTDYFRNYLLQYNKTICALENGIDPEISSQFKFRRKESDRLRLSLVLGSSHLEDMKMFTDCGQVLSNSNSTLLDKISISLNGYDLRGSTNNITINPELLKEIADRNLNIAELFKQFNQVGGAIDKISCLPPDLKLKYADRFTSTEQKPIQPHESVWFQYEKIITDNYKLIKDPDYLAYLQRYVNEPYENENTQVYRRYFTKNINSYATHYDNTDVSIVLLKNDSEFNRCKSALKICEAQAKHCVLIVSSHPIYNLYLRHGVNSLIAQDSRDYIKLIKRYANNPNMVVDHQNQLREDVKDVFDLTKITEKRVAFYKELLHKKGRI